MHFERDVIRASGGAAAPSASISGPRRAPGSRLEFWIEADAFMRSMVRVLVGTMLEVGGGRRDLDDFLALLRAPPASRPAIPRSLTASTWRASVLGRQMLARRADLESNV